MYSKRYKKKVVKHYRFYGMSSTLSAFKVKSKNSILNWHNKLLTDPSGKSLINKSTAPKTIYYRHNKWNSLIYDLIRSIRSDNFVLTKEKVFVRMLRKLIFNHKIVLSSYPKELSRIVIKLLNQNKQWLESLESFTKSQIKEIKVPSVSTTGRIIGDLKNKFLNCGGLIQDPKSVSFFANTSTFRTHQSKNKRRKKINRTPTVKNAKSKGLDPNKIKTKANEFLPFQRVQQDTVEIRFKGTKTYLFGLEDLHTRLCFYVAYRSKESINTVDFICKVKQVFGNLINKNKTEFQNDNGSEYQKHFKKFLNDLNITQYFNYPNSPKMNACIERTNRTIQEEFVTKYLYLLNQPNGLNQFNQKLMDWLIYYNTQREHEGIDYFTPLEYLQEYSQSESKMWWTGTNS